MAMKVIKGYIVLIRPHNCVLAGLSIFIGGVVTGSMQPAARLLLAALSGFLICAGGNSINDYFDIEIDRINKPNRPLPSGIITPIKAFVFSLILFISGFAVSFFINISCIIIAGITCLLLYFYSRNFKRMILVGNAVVALLTGLAFVYGGVAVGNVYKAGVVGVFALFYHFAREIIKDIEDKKGDSSEGVKSYPVKYGDKAALLLTSIILILLIGVTIIPYFLGIFSVYYLIIVAAGVDVFLVYVMVSMWSDRGVANLRRLEILMKINMLVGLLAVYVGSFR